jgi:hypothetical protein
LVGLTIRRIGSVTPSTDDYLPGAFCEQALGYVLNLDAFEGQPVAISLLADSPWPVVISS